MAEIVRIGLPEATEPVSMGGVLTAVGQHVLDAQDAARREAERANLRPVVQGLAGHIRAAWEIVRDEKDLIEDRMLQGVRQRRGEYDPKVRDIIREQGGSDIYMMLSAAKARTISSWLREIMMTKGTEKPWTLEATPVPELPTGRVVEMIAEMREAIATVAQAGVPVDPAMQRRLIERRRDDIVAEMREEAQRKANRMEDHMEDQLVEGSFMNALSQAIDDLTTFPAMILKGPVMRNRKRLSWENEELVVRDQIVLEWERVDPLLFYPSPDIEDVNCGDLIEFHRMSRSDLNAMIGVEGYSDEAIRAVLDEHGRGGLREWTSLDNERAEAEGRETHTDNPSKLIDALQFWGSVQGRMLIDWGMDETQVPDPTREYEVEAWLIGHWVIKAVINPEYMGRRPYYVTSWEKIPGNFWGNSPMDQLRDCQAMCNAAARAIANNAAIASGPQAWVNVDRLPPGEDLTDMHPWKIWQTTSDPMGSTAPPVGFFQPNSNVAELMALYDKFSAIADEVVGVPKYMAGEAPGGGIGRTATGMSMLMSHAGKVMQQAVALIDLEVMTPLLERLYQHNMRYADDPGIKGDAKVRARGATSLMVRESMQLRRNEFLAMTNNPVDLQITGIEGRAAVLREQAKALNMNVDKIVPDTSEMAERQQLVDMSQQAAMQPRIGAGATLDNGEPVANSFQMGANTQ